MPKAGVVESAIDGRVVRLAVIRVKPRTSLWYVEDIESHSLTVVSRKGPGRGSLVTGGHILGAEHDPSNE
jgi:hypothetical protein